MGYTLVASASGQSSATSAAFRVGLTPSFTQTTSVAVNGSANSQIVAVGDWNKDGNLDVACANANDIAVRLGNGTGGLGAQSLFATFSNQQCLASGDFDKDGNLDLVSAGDGKLSFLKGTGMGTFPTHVEFDALNGPKGIDVGDLDGDQDLDVVLTEDGTVAVMVNNGSGSFARQTYTGSTLEQARGVRLADLNQDGKLDLAIACFTTTSGAGGALWYGTGTPGNFFPTANQNNQIASGSEPTLMVGTGDFDADGDTDVCLATVNGGASKFRAFRNLGTGNFTLSHQLDVSPDCFGGAMLDVNQDGLADYVAGSTFGFNNNGTGENDVFISKGDGTFLPALPGSAFKIAPNQVIRSLATGDFNNDGKPDFVTVPGTFNLQLNTSN